jgi:hypothetical protein
MIGPHDGGFELLALNLVVALVSGVLSVHSTLLPST